MHNVKVPIHKSAQYTRTSYTYEELNILYLWRAGLVPEHAEQTRVERRDAEAAVEGRLCDGAGSEVGGGDVVRQHWLGEGACIRGEGEERL